MTMITSTYHQTKTQIADDGRLIEAAKKDPQKFEPLYKKYYKQILEFAYQRLDGKQEAYDIASQVFLKALQNLHKYEHRGLPFSSWLYRIAMNELNQYFRKTKQFRTVNLEAIGMGQLIDEMRNEDSIENQNRLNLCLQKLSSGDFLILEMRFFENRRFKEIAEILDITENNAKVKTYRAIDRLKRIFK